MAMETLAACRALFDVLTPLKTDCGALCGGACCASHAGEETGMLLFPGEERYYTALPGFRLQATDHGTLLICSGACDRCDRPISCRIFPLLPVVRGGEIKVAMDARARVVCPLHRQGISGLQQSFTEAVRTCGQYLLADDETRPALEHLTQIHDELKALRSAFSGR